VFSWIGCDIFGITTERVFFKRVKGMKLVPMDIDLTSFLQEIPVFTYSKTTTEPPRS
jgi:hypothetical protein